MEAMPESDDKRSIREEDIASRPVERRAFLGRFGLVAGMAGLMGWTAGCGQGGQSTSDSCDTDPGDPADADPSDPADSDSGDPCDSD
jgi:ferric-dicitrate binding protein FerR (iron transport regulator)